jgi:hypothetical protein
MDLQFPQFYSNRAFSPCNQKLDAVFLMFTRTGIHPGVKPEDMLRSKTL